MKEQFSLPPGYRIGKYSKSCLEHWLDLEFEYLAAYYYDEKIGSISFINEDESTKIGILTVNENHRDKTIGSCLVQAVVQQTDKPVYLATASAKEFYTRLGFKVDYEQKFLGFNFGFVMVLHPHKNFGHSSNIT